MTTITVDTDGTTGDYSSLSAAVAALPDPLTDDYTIECAASTGAADTTSTTIDVGLGTYSLTVKAASGNVAGTSLDSSKYRFASTSFPSLVINVDVTFDGLQFDIPAYRSIEAISGAHVTMLGCYVNGGWIGLSAYDFTVVNSIFAGAARHGVFKRDGGGYAYLYNSTVINANQDNGSYSAVQNQNTWSASRMLYIKNTYAHAANSGSGFAEGGQRDLTTCASYDGSDGTTTAAFSTSSGAYFTDITLGSEDVAIGSSSALIDQGTDLSADAVYAFSTDIDGDTRSGTWDIGADEYVSAGGGTTQELIGTLSGTGGVSAALEVERLLSGTASATGAVDAVLAVSRLLSAAVSGTAGSTADLDVTRALSANTSGTGDLSGLLTVTRSLAAQADGVSTLSGAITVTRTLAGTLAATGGTDATLSVESVERLAGTLSGTGGTDAALTIRRALSGDLATTGDVAAALQVIRRLSGEIAGQAGASGSLQVGEIALAVGRVSVALEAKLPGAAFTSTTPSATFDVTAPGVTWEGN